jgi:hypothetical protein
VDIDSGPGSARSIQGQLLRRSEHREVAIFLRDGALWVADFIDGNGRLIDATTWFRFNCGGLANSHARRRMALESATPISLELGERIAALHGSGRVGRGQLLVGRVRACITGLRRGRLVALVTRRSRGRNSHMESSAQ